jgi:signal transduction histidine kinase
MKFTILRLLTHSELGMFHSYRRSGREGSKQRAINFDADVVGHVFPAAKNSDHVALACRCLEDAKTVVVKEQRLKKQDKNWRLEGYCPRSPYYDFVKPGVLFAMVVDSSSSPALASWVVIPIEHPASAAIVSHNESARLGKPSMIALQEDEGAGCRQILAEHYPQLFDQDEVTRRVPGRRTVLETIDVGEPETVMVSGNATMRPRARIISLLGEELVSDERVAIVELVKNSYDADATQVEVKFEGVNNLIPDALIISDNGVGMSLDTVLNGWFEPGTISKKQTLRSPSGRLYQGAKGVGRFAAARLARTLRMETRVEGEEHGVAVDLDWGSFTDNSYLDEVELNYEVRPIHQLQHGTIIKLFGLRKKKEWAEEDFKSLHERLSRLVSPFGDVDDFNIVLDIPGHPELTGVVESHRLTQMPKYRLEGELDGTGGFSGAIYLDEKEVKSFRNHRLGGVQEKPSCGGFKVEIRAWDRDRVSLAPYMLELNMGIREVRATLDAYSGASIYRDGFRVHPYGEPGNDWLQLDHRSRQAPTIRLANNQVVSAIRISQVSNEQLIDRTTREGLVHNRAYDDLRDWYVRVLALLEEERYRLRPREAAEPEETRTLFEVFDLTPVVQEADRQLGEKHPVSQMVRQSDSDIRAGVKKVQEHYSRLLLTAGIGQIVDLVIHEIGAPIGRANRELAYLEKQLDKWIVPDRRAEAKESIVAMKGWLEQIVALRNRLDPKAAGRRGRATSFDVHEEVEGNIMLFENLIGKQRITVEVHKPGVPMVVHMARSALGQILANLLDNSIFWLARHHGDGKGGRISIRILPLDGGFQICFCDDGPGVEEADRERIFDSYYSTKPNGMGLGLYVARQVVERYGKMIYRQGCVLPGACFEVSFVRNVGL